jgi:hypothetical protein
MIMVSDYRTALHSRPAEAIERMIAVMVRLDDELAQSGELVYTEVLEDRDSATVVDATGGLTAGAGSALSRYWVVKVADKARAVAIAASLAEVLDAPVELRRCLEQSLKP